LIRVFALPFISSLAALLTSVIVLISGNGLLSTLVPLRAKLEHFPEFSIGILGSVYFAGMLAGTLAAPAILRRAGYIRAFSAFVSLAIMVTLIFPIILNPLIWISLRGLLGFAFAGLYGVIEAWISAKSENANRGRIYGVYQVANFVGSAIGQQILIIAVTSKNEML
jgi:MFS family permease